MFRFCDCGGFAPDDFVEVSDDCGCDDGLVTDPPYCVGYIGPDRDALWTLVDRVTVLERKLDADK